MIEATPGPSVRPTSQDEPSAGLSDWLLEALAERQAAGWNPRWPFVPVDLLNADFRDFLRQSESLTAEAKLAALSFAPEKAHRTLELEDTARRRTPPKQDP